MSALGADQSLANATPLRFAAQGIEFGFGPDCGIISDFVVTDQGQRISMMHRAPWVGTGMALPDGAPPHQARLEGDFFCAPFSDASMDNAPSHGWPANGHWSPDEATTAKSLRCTLDQKVMGATVTKELSLTDNHPFLYQRHIFTGGQGAIPAANHAMISLPNGGTSRFSPKRWFETPAAAPETDPSRGRSSLRYPARSIDPRYFPAATGGTIDLTQYPFGPAHEDFVIALEAPDSPLGWTAVSRRVEGDLYISLRNPRRLPMTMLWHSNGGRDYTPWLGRHTGCLGVEEGIALPLSNITAELLTGAGQDHALVLTPDGKTETRHITGCIVWPAGEAVQNIALHNNVLTVQGDSGASRTVPIDGGFLQL